jgi:hypothetical protein
MEQQGNIGFVLNLGKIAAETHEMQRAWISMV